MCYAVPRPKGVRRRAGAAGVGHLVVLIVLCCADCAGCQVARRTKGDKFADDYVDDVEGSSCAHADRDTVQPLTT